MLERYTVLATWDGEAGVWVATSDDVPGLVTEAPSEDALNEKLRILIPELLELNGILPAGRTGRVRIPFTVRHESEQVAYG